MTRILGIDPGSRKTGFGIIDIDGRKLRYVTSGVIRLPTDEELPVRLAVLFDNIGELLVGHQPDCVSIEQVFMAKNASSALKLGQARGAAIVACASRGLPVAEYSARQIKQSVVGTGAADKEQVQHMVKTLLALPGVPQEDAADALAAAICHFHTDSSLAQIAGGSGVRRGRIR